MEHHQRKTARCSGRRGVSMFGLRRADCIPTPRGCFKVEGVACGFAFGGARHGWWFINARKCLVLAVTNDACEVEIHHGPLVYRVFVRERSTEVALRQRIAWSEGGDA